MRKKHILGSLSKRLILEVQHLFLSHQKKRENWILKNSLKAQSFRFHKCLKMSQNINLERA
jgi:hypothetical protein